MGFQIEAKLTTYITLAEEDIDDIMISALEGGVVYWADAAKVDGSYLGEYASEQISHGGKLKFHLIEALENDKRWYVLDRDKFLKGFKMWIESCDDTYGVIDNVGSVDCGNIDSRCADEIVQYALFGKLVFG
jgi:hypothetical protein